MIYPVIVVVGMRNILSYHDLFEEILCQKKRLQFGVTFSFGIDPQSRLNVDPSVRIVYYKVDFFLHVAIIGSICHNADINRPTATDKLVVNDVFHDVTGIILPVIQPRVTKSDICVIILVRVFEIGLSLNVLPTRFIDKEGVDDMLDIRRDQHRIDFFVFNARQGICNICWIGQGTDFRGDKIKNIVQDITARILGSLCAERNCAKVLIL